VIDGPRTSHVQATGRPTRAAERPNARDFSGEISQLTTHPRLGSG
jgi:hypothetical protein